MSSKTIHSIVIGVKTWFRSDLSDPESENYFYNYQISIENQSEYRVQLIKRYWRVDHLAVGSNIVTGDGVVGEQPILEPNQSYEYTSGCEFWNAFGKMTGYYTFKNLDTGDTFTVAIPEFQLIFPPILN
jgi:ApaG protein